MLMRLMVLCFALLPAMMRADPLRVAVAANLLPVAEEIATIMNAEGHDVRLSGGATGTLYAQIRHGGPFDLFLAADEARPAALEAAGLGRAEPYAIGRLVLWSADANAIGDDPSEALRAARVVAIANPKLAPYGLAAQDVLEALGIAPARVVMGQNIGQTAGLVATGNAPLGFLAASVVPDGGSRWIVPPDMYRPIRQDLVILRSGPVAERFVALLRGPEGQALLASHGYDVPEAAR